MTRLLFCFCCCCFVDCIFVLLSTTTSTTLSISTSATLCIYRPMLQIWKNPKGQDGTDFKMGKDHTYVVTVSKRSYFLRFFSWSLSYLVFCIFCLWKLFSLKLSGTGKHVLSLFPFFCCSSFLHGKFSFTYFCWIIAYESR